MSRIQPHLLHVLMSPFPIRINSLPPRRPGSGGLLSINLVGGELLAKRVISRSSRIIRIRSSSPACPHASTSVRQGSSPKRRLFHRHTPPSHGHDKKSTPSPTFAHAAGASSSHSGTGDVASGGNLAVHHAHPGAYPFSGPSAVLLVAVRVPPSAKAT
jgi:hypothetical protein